MTSFFFNLFPKVIRGINLIYHADHIEGMKITAAKKKKELTTSSSCSMDIDTVAYLRIILESRVNN